MNLCSLILVLFFSFINVTNIYSAKGKASFYADRMHGQPTASGERYDKADFTAAHATLPFDTRVQVTNLRNGKSVIVKINDRMSRRRHHIIDLSKAAANEIGIVREGVGTVKVEIVKDAELGQQVSPSAVSKTAWFAQN